MLQGYISSPFRSPALRLSCQIYYFLNASRTPGIVFFIMPFVLCMSQSARSFVAYFVTYLMPSICLRTGAKCVRALFVPELLCQTFVSALNPWPTLKVSGMLNNPWLWYPAFNSKASAHQKKNIFSSLVHRLRRLRTYTSIAVLMLFNVSSCCVVNVQKYAGLCGSISLHHSKTLFFSS